MRWSDRGDTLIEVLFAIAVVGFVLGLSYASASRSLQIGRDAQEHVEALKVAETQIERLKYLASTVDPAEATPLNDVFSAAESEFCLDDNFQKVLPPFSATGCEPGSSLYKGIVKYDGDSTFVVTVSWDRIVTKEKGNVQLAYKLHEGTN
jgi:type II secretory pathway pseudopilin PulG